MHEVNSRESLLRRAKVLLECEHNTEAQAMQMALCSRDTAYFINTFGVTYDPRLVLQGSPAFVPFDLFPRQREFVDWVEARLDNAEEGLVEKIRGAGFTWLMGAIAIHRWLFVEGFLTSFGSRKEELVDKIGDPKAIFPKMRQFLYRLPKWMLPPGFDRKQHDSHMKIINPKYENTITGEAGSNMGRGGRAQPLDERLLTPTGWITIGDVKPGDWAIGINGYPTLILSVHPQGVKEVFRVTFDDGSSTKCCAEHLWQVTDRGCRKVIRRQGNRTYGKRHHVLPTGHLAEHLMIVRQDGQKEYRYQVPIVGAVQFVDGPLPIDPYLLGALLGDGSISRIEHTSVGFTSSEEDMVGLISQALPGGMETKKVKDSLYDYRIVSSDGGRHGSGVLNPLKAALFVLGLNGTKSGTKFVPDQYKYASVQARVDLLQGLLDTDGWVSVRGKNKMSSKVCFDSISEQLVKDVIEIVQSLGGTATKSKREGRRRLFPQGRWCDCQNSYCTIICLPTGIIPFRLPRKANIFKERIKYRPRRSIVSVIPMGQSECVCICVEAENGLYVTNDFIVTHNSALYAIDEAGHLTDSEDVEAAISDNADCKIWGSTPNTMADTFGRKRHGGHLRPDQIFTFHLYDDPRRTPEWEAKKRLELASTPWIWAREFGLDYTATVEGICIPAEWVSAAVELGKRNLWHREDFPAVAGLDVADGGGGRSVYQSRFGPIIVPNRSWTHGDTTSTAIEAAHLAHADQVQCLFYDEVGVGRGVLSTMSRIGTEDCCPELKGLVTRGVNVGRPARWDVTWEDGQTSRTKFGNLKGELWWTARERFHAAWEHLRFLDGVEGGVEHDPDDLFIFEPAPPVAEEGHRDPHRELIVQISLPKRMFNAQGKIVIERKEQLAARGVSSPDEAEALILGLMPVDPTDAQLISGSQPILTQMERGFPELDLGVQAIPTGGGFDPAVRSGHRFDRDFERDW